MNRHSISKILLSLLYCYFQEIYILGNSKIKYNKLRYILKTTISKKDFLEIDILRNKNIMYNKLKCNLKMSTYTSIYSKYKRFLRNRYSNFQNTFEFTVLHFTVFLTKDISNMRSSLSN